MKRFQTHDPTLALTLWIKCFSVSVIIIVGMRDSYTCTVTLIKELLVNFVIDFYTWAFLYEDITQWNDHISQLQKH